MIRHLEGDCRQVLPTLPAGSVHCVVTSPAYYQLRSHLDVSDPRKPLEIGLEQSPEAYVENLVSVFRAVWRVLCDRGTLWLNLGDTYASSRRAKRPDGKCALPQAFIRGKDRAPRPENLTAKDLIGIPWRVVFALQADGWILRCDNIWEKPNVMPEPVKDRPTRSHEYLFLLTKKDRYYYNVDALREPVTSSGGACFGKQRHSAAGTGAQSRRLKSAAERNHPLGKNKRSVWRVPVASFPGAHFATFPPELIRPCILAGCPAKAMVLDPFAGSGTTGIVAEALGRDSVLIELNPVYVEMQKERARLNGILVPTVPTAPSAHERSNQEQPGPSEKHVPEQRSLWDEV